MTDGTRVPLYDRLPEIYRIEDAKQSPPYPLRAFVGLAEGVFDEIHANIEALYHDLFIETCDDWVIPYIADLVGTSHLAGDPWTLRADVANTIALRRRKGTLGAIELLTYSLTRWGVHAVELRRNLAWAQHLNHQRPDAGGDPPQLEPDVDRNTPVRGGTAVVRNPATLSLLDTPFDPFAHMPDLRPPLPGALRYNLPNLAIFLWRLEPYRVNLSRPVFHTICPTGEVAPLATHNVHFDVDPLGERVRLFNLFEFDEEREPPVVTDVDRTPGPIHPARLDSPGPGGAGGVPEAYVDIDRYTPGDPSTIEITDDAIQLHVPAASFPSPPGWTFRGADLADWEATMGRQLAAREIAVDPRLGRLAIGTTSLAQANALRDHLLLTWTYGAVGPVGAHPISRDFEDDSGVTPVAVTVDGTSLQAALANLQGAADDLVIEIGDSRIHDLDLSLVAGTAVESGGPNLLLAHSLTLRAADGHRPIVRLAQPLRFRPANPASGGQTVRFEGVFLTRGAGFPGGEPLIARAAVHRLELDGSTLDPGGRLQLDGTRAPVHDSLRLRNVDLLDETPEIDLDRTISGALRIGRRYALAISSSIVDAGSSVGEDPSSAGFAVTGGGPSPATSWGPPTKIDGATFFGRVRVEELSGRGGIWTQRLQVLNDQVGCVRTSYFSGLSDRLPQNRACVLGTEAFLRFTSEIFGEPAYGQIALESDFDIRERGPDDDAMGAFGFLLEAHKWRNLQIRYREFMPVGVRPLVVPVT